ncbi:MAG: hypothetical protein ACT4P5_18165 [Armatimonadota bacterium]
MLLITPGCQIRRQAAPVGVGLLHVRGVARATDRAALSPVAWAPDGGRFAYGGRDGVWVHTLGDAAGAKIAPGETVTAVAWSPTANVLAYVDRGALSMVRLDGRGLRRIPVQGLVSQPVWAPGGDRLAVIVRQPGNGKATSRLWLTSPDGATLRQILWNPPSGRDIVTLGWFPDTLYLFVGLAPSEGGATVEWWKLRISYPEFRRLPSPPRPALESSIAPDGHWVAFVAEESEGARA